MLLSARVCRQASMRAFVCACMRACFYCAPEVVFQSVLEIIFVCFCLPVLVTVSKIVLHSCVSVFWFVYFSLCLCDCAYKCV